jgi:nucleoid-associated protein YgaU
MKTKEYRVVPGDTLGGISLKRYGHAYWQHLYGMNREMIEKEQMRRDRAELDLPRHGPESP